MCVAVGAKPGYLVCFSRRPPLQQDMSVSQWAQVSTSANMYVIPVGLLVRGDAYAVAIAGKSAEELVNLTWTGLLVNNLVPVTLGNMSGGVVMGTGVYWFVYVRQQTFGGRADV